jgi:methylmalonyl-CoA/ethylmalonyl-CoA epimerase
MLGAILDLTLHHIGYAVKAIEPVSITYVTRFGYVVRTPIIHDPLQTALVQFLSLPGENIFLELVSPDGPESFLTDAASKRPGLHHLCYSTDSLEATSEWLVQNDMMLISSPQPAVAFRNRRICWLLGEDSVPIELVERTNAGDVCDPGL